MKTQLALGLLLLNISFAPIALATNQPPENAMKMSQILERLQQEGYYLVKSIEYNGKVYEVEVLKNDGDKEKIEITINGEVIKANNDKKLMSLMDAIKQVENSGYKNIYKIKADAKKYEIKAYDKDNKQVDLDVDATTGQIED
jgi:hypothetical protein